MMFQHLRKEVDHFARRNALFEQPKQQVSRFADGGHCCDSATFASDSGCGRLTARRPCLAQECCQRDVRLVLEIEDRPVFLDTFANLRHFVTSPFSPRFLVDLVVFSLRFLVRQSSFPQPTPNSVSRNGNVILLLNHAMQAANGPQIRLVSKRGCRPQHNRTKFTFIQFFQFSRATAARPARETCFAILLVSTQPAMQGLSCNTIRIRGIANCPTTLHCLHSTNANFNSRVSFLAHKSELCDIPESQSTSM